MEWLIVNPSSLHEVCGLLGYTAAGGNYHVKKDSCSDALEELLAKLLSDGPSLLTRRSLGHSQVFGRDLIPFLVSASTQQPKAMPMLIKLITNLSSPIECLISTDFVQTEEGQQVVYEIESLLKGVKAEFTKFNVTKAVVEYLKDVINTDDMLTPEECNGVSDGLLLLRNILHIPNKEPGAQYQILWNLFAHSIDKILLHLMNCEQKNLWAIPLVQLIALIYKDQHVANLQKLLNLWLETSMSESSEDNESNTSPPDHSSSPTMTSDPTSDSSDTGGMSNQSNSNISNTGIEDNSSSTNSMDDRSLGNSPSSPKLPHFPFAATMHGIGNRGNSNVSSTTSNDKETQPMSFSAHQNHKMYTKGKAKKNGKGASSKEKNSDADSGISSSHFSVGELNTLVEEKAARHHHPSAADMQANRYQTENKESNGNSTSSNDDDPHRRFSTKQRSNKLSGHRRNHGIKLVPQIRTNSILSAQDKREMKRKRLHKRSRRTKTSMKALVHHNPTEEDISHVLREFTVDFLLKGYGSLVSVLQEQLSQNASLQMDKSHFLWLITYFLKFASQMELDLEHISPVLSLKILSYLTFEGVAMCENLQICKDDLKPHLRRMHLVVTALREFVQAVEIYSKAPSGTREDKLHIAMLQNQMLGVQELRHLFVMLIRYFKPGVQSKQYLQDLVITNHVFLLLMEKISTSKDYKGNFDMFTFVKEFASPLIVQQYGHLLEDFKENGGFVNDCVFTMMHHIAGDLTCPEALYQPSILKTFSSIWEVEFEIRDDWADLIEYVIQRFMKASNEEKRQIFKSGTSHVSDDIGWSKEDFNNLYWFYTKCSTSRDPIAKILELYNAVGCGKTRESILNQLLHQRIIGYNQFLLFLASEKRDGRRRDGAATDGSSVTSSSHATAGSSCYSRPSSPMDEASYTMEGSGDGHFYTQLDPYPFTKTGTVEEESDNAESQVTELEKEDKITQEEHAASEDMDTDSAEDAVTKPSITADDEEAPEDTADVEITASDLINQLLGEGHTLGWLQKQVLEACYVKLRMELKQIKLAKSRQNGSFLAENNDTDEIDSFGAIPYHYSLLGQSIPIIPWTHWQEILLMSPQYLLLLHKLGFHLPGDVEKIFPRIPHFWTAEVLLAIATQLGPIPSKETLKFDPDDVIHTTDTNVNSQALESNVSSTVTSRISGNEINSMGMGIGCVDESTFKMPTGMGSSFMSPHSSYGFGSATHSVNWMTLVHKSKQLIDRHSEPVKTESQAEPMRSVFEDMTPNLMGLNLSTKRDLEEIPDSDESVQNSSDKEKDNRTTSIKIKIEPT